MRSITIKDVAKEAGVSTTLVSRVMNAPLDKDGIPVCAVNRATAMRIIGTIRRMGYRPNTAAASLRKKKKKRIGVILPDISNQYFAPMAREFERIAREEGYTVLFGSSSDNAGIIEDLAMTFCYDNADGIILVPGEDCGPAVERIVNQRIPMVLAVRDIPEIHNVGKVLSDNIKASGMALDHLGKCGFKRVEMLSTTLRISTVIEREKLFLEYMEGKGRGGRILHCDSNNPEESIRFIIENALRRGTDAFYCPSATNAVIASKICREEGIRIPEDIGLMGYDGPSVFDAITPSITQISFRKDIVAREAFNTLKKMTEEHCPEAPVTLVEPELIIGDSTAGKKATDDGPSTGKPREQLQKAIAELRKLERMIST